MVDFWSRNKWWIFTVLLLGCYASIISTRAVPPCEGWYTYYSVCLNHGEILYKDIEYLLPPLYIQLIAFLTKIGGYSLIFLRIVGVIIFCGIGIIIYKICELIFGNKSAFVAAVTSCMYMQTDVANVFYDYIRVMDIFVYLTVFFLLNTVKYKDNSKLFSRYLLLSSICNVCIFLTKQNVGGIFLVWASMYIFLSAFVISWKWKEAFLKVCKYIITFCCVTAIPVLIVYFSGTLDLFFTEIVHHAIVAKGGISNIFMIRFEENIPAFLKEFFVAILFSGIMIIMYSIAHNKEENSFSDKGENVISLSWGISFLFGLWTISAYPSVAKLFGTEVFNLTVVFDIMVVLFVYFFIAIGVRILQRSSVCDKYLLYMCVIGSYIIISLGCIMSGGLAASQSILGISFIIASFLELIPFRKYKIILPLYLVCILVCLNIALVASAKKMFHPYYWWTLEEVPWWEHTTTAIDIDILKGIFLSPQEAAAYEKIYHIIQETTNSEDPIYCFPHIPLFYNICNRKDPGIRGKVAWFDVVSDSTIDFDIDTIKKNPPKAVLIFDLPESVYEGHERLFRNGNGCGTRKMRNFLLNYVQENGYEFYGRISSAPNNHFLLWINTTVTPGKIYSFVGDGSKEKPYLIQSLQDLFWLRETVAKGNNYAGCYFKQTVDIDLPDTEAWKPIGIPDKGLLFRGYYDGNGCVINNLNCERAGLFDVLAGNVANLGVLSTSDSIGKYGAIASRLEGESASLINCYTETKTKVLFSFYVNEKEGDPLQSQHNYLSEKYVLWNHGDGNLRFHLSDIPLNGLTLAINAVALVTPDMSAPTMRIFIEDKFLDCIPLPSTKSQWKYVHVPKSCLTESWAKLRLEIEAKDKGAKVVFHQFKISEADFFPEVYQLGTLEDFSTMGNGCRYLNWQWGEPQPHGTWLIGNSGRMQMYIDQIPPNDLMLRFHATAFLSEEVPRRTIKIFSIDNQCLGEYLISNPNHMWYNLRIPKNCIQGNYLCLRFEIDSPHCESIGQMGIFLHAVQIDDMQHSY